MDGTNAGTAADNGEKPRYEVAFVFLLTNQSFFNIIRWVDGPNDSATKRLMLQVLFFFFIISLELLCKNRFNLFSYYTYFYKDKKRLLSALSL